MLHVPVFLRYTLISGIDSFLSLTSSIRVPFLGHTNLEILQSLQILLVFGVFTVAVSVIVMHGKNPLYSKVVLVVRYLVLLEVVSSVESSSNVCDNDPGMTLKYRDLTVRGRVATRWYQSTC